MEKKYISSTTSSAVDYWNGKYYQCTVNIIRPTLFQKIKRLFKRNN